MISSATEKMRVKRWDRPSRTIRLDINRNECAHDELGRLSLDSLTEVLEYCYWRGQKAGAKGFVGHEDWDEAVTVALDSLERSCAYVEQEKVRRE